MKLSEAILLGDSLRERRHTLWLTKIRGHYCGCALGGASLAAGLHGDGEMGSSEIMEAWPWLTLGHLKIISSWFRHVCGGYNTLEELVDRVRLIESLEDPGIINSKEEVEQCVHSLELHF